MELSPDEFWSLSLYEWSLYIERLEFINQKENARSENLWAMCRVIWSTIMNRWRGESEPVYKPEDLIKLSFDKEEEIKPKLTIKEAMQSMGSKFKTDGN